MQRRGEIRLQKRLRRLLEQHRVISQLGINLCGETCLNAWLFQVAQIGRSPRRPLQQGRGAFDLPQATLAIRLQVPVGIVAAGQRAAMAKGGQQSNKG